MGTITMKALKIVIKKQTGMNVVPAGTLNGSRCYKLKDDYGRCDQILRHKSDLACIAGYQL